MHDSGITLSTSDGRRRNVGSAPLHPFLCLVLQGQKPLAPSSRHSLEGVDRVIFGRGPVHEIVRREEAGQRLLVVRIPDPWMSATHAQLVNVLSRWVLEDTCSRNGTLVNGVAQVRAALADSDVLELGRTFFLYRDAGPPIPSIQADYEVSAADKRPGLVTLSPSLKRDFEVLAQVAPSTVSIILSGESGTGKEVIARAIHALSGRSGPLVPINCGALPETLIESELFGHRKGAFSGATEDRPGLIRSADRGTLFLDEIGDLPASSQAAFLRVLQEREVTPVGGTRPIPIDLRVVAATHRDLGQLVDDGKFRADLLARLSGHFAFLPPLRERREDMGLVIASLLLRLAQERADQVALSGEAARALLLHDWPLNVRELEKCLEKALVLSGAGAVERSHVVPNAAMALGSRAGSTGAAPVSGSRALSDEDGQRREELIALLTQHSGNVSAVARAMGKARVQIRRWLKRFQIDAEAYRR
ncbi:MAG: sigma 54-interacting transcriptional regulator [Deltaproteobacteria bacterium]|nr:sigma 54-interacting transcriptional regulator [Deltaproteobacteria bacterium]